MLYCTFVTLPMYTELAIPTILSLKEWEKSFLKYSSKVKKDDYKAYFIKCYELVKLAISCHARHLIVKNRKKSLEFIFDFWNEEGMDNFVHSLSDNNLFQI